MGPERGPFDYRQDNEHIREFHGGKGIVAVAIIALIVVVAGLAIGLATHFIS